MELKEERKKLKKNNGAEKKQETEGRRNVLMVSSTAWWVIFLFRIDEALSLLRMDFVAIFAVGFQVLAIMFPYSILRAAIWLQGDSQITMGHTFHQRPIWWLRPNSVFELFRISQIFLSKE